MRSVDLEVPDLERAEAFYSNVWRLSVAARTSTGIYLRGAGPDHHLLALHAGGTTAIRHVTLRARDLASLNHVAVSATSSGGRILAPLAPVDEPGGGTGIVVLDPHGRRFRVVHGDERHQDTVETVDRPMRLAHAVLNSHDIPTAQHFLEAAFGFRLSDRTRIMAFMNCNGDHHSIAFGDSDNDALNHIAFLMPDVDAVMRGGGRMRDAGFGIEWGPGRHGPGDNAFNYFIGPFGEVIEYTAEVQQIDDSYCARGPEDWIWPAGRVDQWGISQPPSQRLKQAQRSIHFVKEIAP